MKTLIWDCTVCLCPKNGALGLYGLKASRTNKKRRLKQFSVMEIQPNTTRIGTVELYFSEYFSHVLNYIYEKFVMVKFAKSHLQFTSIRPHSSHIMHNVWKIRIVKRLNGGKRCKPPESAKKRMKMYRVCLTDLFTLKEDSDTHCLYW